MAISSTVSLATVSLRNSGAVNRTAFSWWKALQRGIVRRADIAHGGVGHQHGFGNPPLRLTAEQVIDQHTRRLSAGRDRTDQLGPFDLGAEQIDVAVLGQLIGRQDTAELVGVELAELVVEGGLGAKLAEHQRIADPQSGIISRERQQGPLDKLVQRLVDQTQRLRLFRVDLAAQHLAQAAHFLAEGIIQLGRGNLHVTDLCGSGVGPSTENVADAPHPEAEDQEDEQDLHDPGADGAAQGLKHVPTS